MPYNIIIQGMIIPVLDYEYIKYALFSRNKKKKAENKKNNCAEAAGLPCKADSCPFCLHIFIIMRASFLF